MLLILLGIAAWLKPAAAADDDLCRSATEAAERQTGVPDQLLGAISRVETGRYDADSGMLRAWPWTINAQGKGHFYASKQDAVRAARDFQTAGIRSIDVGCMQINLMFHPDGFSSLEEAFDPGANARYAANFLIDLFHQTGSWPHAAAAYHSQTPDLGIDYQRKVLAAWAEPIDRPSGARTHQHAARVASASHASAAADADAGDMPGTGEPADPETGGASVAARPLGGFGHIIRAPGAPAGGAVGRTLAAYRAFPVAMVALPQRRFRY